MVRTYKPKPKFKMLPCRYCGERMQVGWKTKKAPAHRECSVRVAVEAQRQMSEKSGPYYEKWRAGMLNYIVREGMATLPPIENTAPSNPD